ncbi:MAG: DPP IV N-terminal domain-containing protein [Holophagae bacterium]
MSPTGRRMLLIAVFAGCVAATAAAGTQRDLDTTLDRLFGTGAVEITAPDPVWRPGHRTVVWIDRTSHAAPVVIEFDPTTGARRTLIDPTSWAGTGAGRNRGAPDLAGLVWRPDGNGFLVTGHDGTVLYDLARRGSTVLDIGPGAVDHSTFAPDGRRVAWVRDHDLWIYDLALHRATRVTTDGSATTFNGVFDWVYQEELAGRDGRAFRWSPDSQSIVWLRLDDREVPVHHLLDASGTHTRVTEQRFPTPGDPSPMPSLHAVRLDGASSIASRVEIGFDDPVPYVPRFGFTPTGDLWYQVLDRSQKRLELVVVDPSNLAPRSTRVVETDPFWTEPVDGLQFLTDGSLLWLSRRSGHTHLHHLGGDGRAVDLTPGPWDVTELVGVDADEQVAWYQAARPKPRDRRLYRVDIATGATVELTAAAGTHSGRLSPSADRVLITSSTAATPPRRRVVDGFGRGAAEVPVEAPLPGVELAEHRFVEITADDGISLDAMLLLPPGFDEARRYPVVVFTYGGPRAQVVVDRWPTTSWLFNHALASAGYVIFALDNRGSAARGRAFEGAVQHRLGSSQLPDQLAGVGWLRGQSWVDPERIGIWGWSYGGYMASYALTHAPGVFAAGAAVAPVTDWRLYDSIYTERYMSTPEANPEGYVSGSVLTRVGDLTDPLLVIHGSGDDNVHLQHTLQLADRAWRNGVRFDLVLFPGLGHGLNAAGARRQVFGAIGAAFEEHLARTP